MNIVNFTDYKAQIKKPKYTKEPILGKNLYKKNLNEKIRYFNESMEIYINNPIIEKCNFSIKSCAVKFNSSGLNFILVLQDYSPDEVSSNFVTWEFFVFDVENDKYIESTFFSSTDIAIKYFISKIKYTL